MPTANAIACIGTPPRVVQCCACSNNKNRPCRFLRVLARAVLGTAIEANALAPTCENRQRPPLPVLIIPVFRKEHPTELLYQQVHHAKFGDGEIVQQGTHEDLVAVDGLYRRFVVERKQAAGWKV